MPSFTPPGVVEHTGIDHPLFGRMTITRGITLLKTDGIYTQSRYPADEDLTAADIVYLGGYSHVITTRRGDAPYGLSLAAPDGFESHSLVAYTYGQ